MHCQCVALRLQGSSAEALLQRYAAPEEVMEMPGHCSACGAPCASRMYQTQIPFFKASSFPHLCATSHLLDATTLLAS